MLENKAKKIDKAYQKPSLGTEMKAMVKLAIPICLGQLAGLSMTFVDTVMAGRAGSIHLSAVAVASSIWIPTTMFAQGLLMPIIPFVAQTASSSHPNEREENAARFLRQGLWLALVVGLVTMLVLSGLLIFLKSLTFDPELISLSVNYLFVMLIGVIPLLFYCVQRYYLEGMGATRPTMFIGFLSLAVNIPLNYIFIFGKFGMPALGAVGCAIASVVVCFCMCFGMGYFAKRKYKKIFTFQKPDFTLIKRIFFIALPNAFALFMEITVFSLVSILIAPLGRDIVSGHQIALNVSSMLFMLPLGLGAVASIRTGSALGLQDKESLTTIRKATFSLSFMIGIFNCSFIFLFREQITHLYTNDLAVIELAMSFLLFCATYQIVDCVQVSAVGLLRGYNDTKALLLFSFLSYWLIAFPTGYSLAFYGLPFIEPIGAYGFWVGMIIGLTCGFIFFGLRVLSLEKQPMEMLLKRFND